MPEMQIQTTQDAAVRTITLNRPTALNAFTSVMLLQLREALDAAANDKAVRCVVITGAGRGFCAGQDLADAPADLGPLLDDYYAPLAMRLRQMPIPVIAAVNGVAAGAGASFALGCDLVLAAESASFIQAFSKIGLVPDCGGSWLLPRLVGRARALQLALLGDKLPATEAVAMGLIYRCVPDAELASAAQALAQRVSAMPACALADTRKAFDDGLLMDFASALKAESATQSRLAQAPDFQEGKNAFLQKRAPQYKDR
jgi:2-(1,2-epoxy-1,2-dihydrophenyl)acetyl-CoA isomerase